MLPPSLVAFVEEPVFVAVATADAELRPSILRASAARIEGDKLRVVVAVLTPDGLDPLARSLDGRSVAVVIGSPIRAVSYQLKGRVATARPASEAELAEVYAALAHLGGQAEETQGVGADLYRRFHLPAGLTVEIDVETCFDQTPGANAGQRLER